VYILRQGSRLLLYPNHPNLSFKHHINTFIAVGKVVKILISRVVSLLLPRLIRFGIWFWCGQEFSIAGNVNTNNTFKWIVVSTKGTNKEINQTMVGAIIPLIYFFLKIFSYLMTTQLFALFYIFLPLSLTVLIQILLLFIFLQRRSSPRINLIPWPCWKIQQLYSIFNMNTLILD